MKKSELFWVIQCNKFYTFQVDPKLFQKFKIYNIMTKKNLSNIFLTKYKIELLAERRTLVRLGPFYNKCCIVLCDLCSILQLNSQISWKLHSSRFLRYPLKNGTVGIEKNLFHSLTCLNMIPEVIILA